MMSRSSLLPAWTSRKGDYIAYLVDCLVAKIWSPVFVPTDKATNVALPDIGKAFDSSQTTLNMIAVGYSFGSA